VVKKLFTKIPCPPQADKSVSKKISVFSVSSVAKQNTVFIRVNLCQSVVKKLFTKIFHLPQNTRFSNPKTCPACLPQNVVIWGLPSA
jgi:hypothetical protein